MELDDSTLEKFSRQVLVDQIGYDGQLKIMATHLEVSAPEPWAQLARRYLESSGFEVVNGVHTDNGDLIVRKVNTTKMWKDELRPPDAIMEKIGILLCQIVRETVSEEG